MTKIRQLDVDKSKSELSEGGSLRSLVQKGARNANKNNHTALLDWLQNSLVWKHLLAQSKGPLREF